LGRSVVILAGGYSKRFGRPKAFVELMGKPLILHVYDKVRRLSDEILVVISPKDRVESFSRLFNRNVKVVIDNGTVHSPLVGTLAGLERASGEYSLLLPCDTPFLSERALSLLFDVCNGFDLTIPRWPNGYIEPLQAVYHTRPVASAAKTALSKGGRDMRSMISLLRRVRYLSTIVLEELDPRLNTFFNVNTTSDLRKAERMLSKA
jgi:molybdopterin-guanine dinucleotide biosynthesis protein A